MLSFCLLRAVKTLLILLLSMFGFWNIFYGIGLNLLGDIGDADGISYLWGI